MAERRARAAAKHTDISTKLLPYDEENYPATLPSHPTGPPRYPAHPASTRHQRQQRETSDFRLLCKIKATQHDKTIFVIIKWTRIFAELCLPSFASIK